jgi:hypothetical protein
MSSISVRIRTLSVERACSSGRSRCFASLWRPCGTVMPRSSRIARNWLIRAVRSPTRRSRARCSVCMSSCSPLFISTKRMVGRVAASPIPSASRPSFFCALTRPDILRRHQPHCVPLARQLPTNVVRAAACFHRNDARRQSRCELRDALPAHPTTLDHSPVLVQHDEAAAILPRSMPTTAIAMACVPSFRWPHPVYTGEEEGRPIP